MSVPSGALRHALALALALGLAVSATQRPVGAQAPERQTAPSPVPVLPPIEVSPRGAFLRALVLPGWGHAAIGAYTRGGVYFAIQSATAYTLLRTRQRSAEARDRVALRDGLLRGQLGAQGIIDPIAIEAALDADAALGELRGLRDARHDQEEDLVAFGIFVLFLGGVDAYVSAHLSRFPAPLAFELEPRGEGGVTLRARVPLPR